MVVRFIVAILVTIGFSFFFYATIHVAISAWANNLLATRTPFTPQREFFRVPVLSYRHRPFSFRRPVHFQHCAFRDPHLQADGQHDQESTQHTAPTTSTGYSHLSCIRGRHPTSNLNNATRNSLHAYLPHPVRLGRCFSQPN